MRLRDALDEHRSALSAADADRCNAAPAAGALEHVQHVQHDPRPRRANRMAERDRTAVDVQLVFIEHTERTRETKLVAAERVVLPCTNTCEHLCRESLVDFPRVD